MRSRAARALVVLVALAALAGAGYQIWKLDGQINAGRSAADAFAGQAQHAVAGLAGMAATERSYVAEGQNADRFQVQMTSQLQVTAQRLADLRKLSQSPEAQASLESAMETMAAFVQTDSKAREYITSGQRLSASDVIFADGADLLARAITAISDARDRERLAHAITIERNRQMLLYYLGGAAGVAVVTLLLLVPLPGARRDTEDEDTASADAAGSHSGLGLSYAPADTGLKSPPPSAAEAPVGRSGLQTLDGQELFTLPDLGPAADLCAALARVQDPRDLAALLERAAEVLGAKGLIVWMPEGAQGVLRPMLAHGYAPLALTRMGSIAPDADNATAVAYRTGTLQTMAAEAQSNAAIVAPLVTADGCTGAMAAELNEHAELTGHRRALATILAAQLATLITPAPPVEPPQPKDQP